MKKRTLLVALLAGAIALAPTASEKDSVKNPVPTGHLISFNYSRYSTMAQPDFEYMLVRNDSNQVCLNVVLPLLDGWGKEVVVDPSVLLHVEKMIKESDMPNYLHMYRSEEQVLDGYRWGYSATFDDGTTLYSGGSNAYPGDNTLGEIGQYLDSCYLQITGAEAP